MRNSVDSHESSRQSLPRDDIWDLSEAELPGRVPLEEVSGLGLGADGTADSPVVGEEGLDHVGGEETAGACGGSQRGAGGGGSLRERYGPVTRTVGIAEGVAVVGCGGSLGSVGGSGQRGTDSGGPRRGGSLLLRSFLSQVESPWRPKVP